MSHAANIINEYRIEENLDPGQMDWAWANGWRHFGSYFFRYNVAGMPEQPRHVIPLRIQLKDFTFSASQKRIWHRNQDVSLVLRDAFIDEEKIKLFEQHKTRFVEHVPDSLYSFLGDNPARIPCLTKEICLFLEEKLIGVTFWDIGEISTSGVYAMFDLTESRRSLGHYMILLSIQFSTRLGKKYYYHGYAYREPSHYDYKKNYAGLQYYDWKNSWLPFTELSKST